MSKFPIAHTDDERGRTTRRSILSTAAWSVPVVAATVSSPLAAASIKPNSDLVLEFADIIQGSTRDISNVVIAYIEQTVRSLGPQQPSEPALVLPPEPAKPSGTPLLNPAAWAAYLRDLAAWTAEVANLNAAYATKVAQYLQDLAAYQVWDLAVRAFVQRLNAVAEQSEGLFFASVTYPGSLTVRNFGPQPLPSGTVVTVEVTSDVNLVNGFFPGTGAVQAVQTGGTALLTYTTATAVAVGDIVFAEPLEYNPGAVTLNITGSVTQSSVTALLAPSSQDTDIADHGDSVSSPVGVRLDVATGDVQAILGEWQQFVQDAVAFYNVVKPYLPEVDWSQVISGLLPLTNP